MWSEKPSLRAAFVRLPSRMNLCHLLHSLTLRVIATHLFAAPDRREIAESAADLRDQAARSTGERRDEAVKVLDQAAARARDDLQALLRVRAIFVPWLVGDGCSSA